MEAALIQAFPGVQVELVGGHRGIFDVFDGDDRVFSKDVEHRFPAEQEVVDLLRKRTA